MFTLDAAKLPGGRGAGEPIRLMADLDEGADIVAVWPYAPGEKMLVATSDGRGFVVGQDEMLSSTRKGRALVNVDAPAQARLVDPGRRRPCRRRSARTASCWSFPLAQVPEMARGKGVRLQRYKDGGLSDARVFKLADGMTWRDSAGRTFTVAQGRSQGLDRQPRRGGPAAAQGLPQEQPLRGLRPIVGTPAASSCLAWRSSGYMPASCGLHLLLRGVARRRPQDDGDLRRRAGADGRQRRAVQSAAQDRARRRRCRCPNSGGSPSWIARRSAATSRFCSAWG